MRAARRRAARPRHLQQLGTSDYSAAQIVIAAGSHTLTADAAFSTTVCGANGPDSFALPGGVGARVIAESSSPTPEPGEDTGDGGGGDGGPVLDCGAGTVAGSPTTCVVTRGDPGIDILWHLRDGEGTVIAKGPVTLDDAGAGSIDVMVPQGHSESRTLELVAWDVYATFAVARPVRSASRPGSDSAATEFRREGRASSARSSRPRWASAPPRA